MKAASGSSSPSLARRILACGRCPRLRAYLESIAADNPGWHCKPVPGLGEPGSPVALVGLAPSRTGANRTGRMFTGDKTGDFLFDALAAAGLTDRIYLTAALKCAPPKDKPLPAELRRCAPFLQEELARSRARVVIALGKIAHDAYLRHRGERLSAHPFAHGAWHPLPGGPGLLDTYHCSPRNTNTGVLTRGMFLSVLKKAGALAGL